MVTWLPAKVSVITRSQAPKESSLRSATSLQTEIDASRPPPRKREKCWRPTATSSSISKSKGRKVILVAIVTEKAQVFPSSRLVIANQRNFNKCINQRLTLLQEAEAAQDLSMGRSAMRRGLRKWDLVSIPRTEPRSKSSNQLKHKRRTDVKWKDNRIIMRIWPN